MLHPGQVPGNRLSTLSLRPGLDLPPSAENHGLPRHAIPNFAILSGLDSPDSEPVLWGFAVIFDIRDNNQAIGYYARLGSTTVVGPDKINLWGLLPMPGAWTPPILPAPVETPNADLKILLRGDSQA